MMPRIRTLPQAIEELKEADPKCGISLVVLRRWVKEGQIPTIKSGRYRYIDMNNLEKFMQGA